MRKHQLVFNEELLTLYHNSEEWVLWNGTKVINWSSQAGELFDLYGREDGNRLYGEIVNATEFGKGPLVSEEEVPREVLELAEKFSE